MAYAALDELAKDLNMFLDHQHCSYCSDTSDIKHCILHFFIKKKHCILLEKKQRIQRLHKNIVFLFNFLGEFAREADKLESRLKDAAIQANNLFRNILPRRDHQLFEGELEKAIVETYFLLEKAMQIKKCSKKNPIPSRLAGDGNATVVGMEEDLLEIKRRLYDGSSELGIIPIVGMGGIGKSTLARSAYDDPSYVHHFDVRVWISISQTYDLKAILSSVLRSIKNVFDHVNERINEEDWPWRNDDLKLKIYRYLFRRRYLIVIDDMWDANLWDELRSMFPDDGNGSRIIITSRELNVASYIDARSHPHEMRLMSVDQSWRLLKESVFGQENCPSELEKIGQVIAEKCRGLPLAIVVIAGVLSCKVDRMKDSWEKIAGNVSKVVSTNDDEHFIGILSLSYKSLPRHLRPCFQYMGCFPEDYEINVSKLIRLWEAEDFLKSNGSKDMEELGYEYLEALATRSLVLISKKGYDGKIRTVKIHDLLRDLCLRKSRDDNFLCTINDFSGSFPQGIENSNRLSVFCNVSGCIPDMESSPMHTILLFKNWALDSLKSFILLRVFDGLSLSLNSSSPVEYIGELIHLRYLALTCEPIAKTLKLVSENLHNLHNLRTLVFRIWESKYQSQPQPQPRSRSNRFLRSNKRIRICLAAAHFEGDQMDSVGVYQQFLKLEIWRMPQLRHLILLDGYLPHPSAEISQSMENLHTLYRMKDFKCTERFLEMIPNLKKLGVIYSHESTYEKGWSEYELNNLVHLHSLEKLSLYAEPYPNSKEEDLSQFIAFPMTLKKLCLSGCRFPWKDMSMIGVLPNLEVLKLKRSACHGFEWKTSEGEFCQLKVLLIDSTYDLVRWKTESSHFPKLERLTLYECGNLREIPSDIGEIATLELIEVDIRNSAMVESAKCIEEEQQYQGNEQLQVRFLKSRSWAKTI